jgi:bifunctional DNase/RNase
VIAVKIEQLFLSNVGFVVLLKGDVDPRALPIFIGAAEAQSIALWINSVKVPRPITHDLLKNVLDYLECRLVRVEICDLKDGVFYAKLILVQNGMETTLDSRPSDAIALAIRAEAPIYVDPQVMDEAGRVIDEKQDAGTGDDSEGGAESAATHRPKALTPMDMLERDLAKAIVDERYEDAARLRDEIKRLKTTHTDN